MDACHKYGESMKRISLNLFVTLTPAMLIAFGAGSLRDDLEGAFWVIILLQACINVYAYIRGLRKETMLLGAVVLTAFPLLFCREAYRNDAEGAIATVALLSFFIGFVSILIKYCIGNRRQNRTFAADDNHCQSVNVASTVVDNINGKAKLTGVLESDEARGAQVALVRRSDESLPDDYIIVSGGNEAIEEMRTKILTQIRRVVDSASILTYTLSKMPDNPDLKMRISANAKEALSEMMVPLLPKNNYLRFGIVAKLGMA